MWGARDLKSFVLRVKKIREKLIVVRGLSELFFQDCVHVVEVNALKLGFLYLVVILTYKIQIASPNLVYFHMQLTNPEHNFC